MHPLFNRHVRAEEEASRRANPMHMMMKAGTWLPAAGALAFASTLGLWQARTRAAYQPPRLAGEDQSPPPAERKAQRDVAVDRSPPDGARTEQGSGKPSAVPGVWPSFRGPGRDALSREETPLARSWPEGGPPVLWSIELGQGHAGAAVRNGRVYVFDYDEADQRDTIRCLSLDDGGEIWSYSYPVAIKRNHGISRTVPAVSDDYLVGIGPRCHVTCLDARTGAFRWRLDLVRQLGTRVPGWYTGQCPLIDKGRAILAPAGPDCLLMAVDCETGEIVWKTPNPHGSKMSHSSVAPMTLKLGRFEGRRTYVYAGTRGVVGVSAEDGRLLWETRAFKWHTIAPTPLPVATLRSLPADRQVARPPPAGKLRSTSGEDRVLFTAGYGAQAVLVRLAERDGKVEAEIVKKTRPRVFGAEQHTPIYYRGHIYAVIPKPRQELVCTDTDLNEIWTSGPNHRFGLGPYMIADGLVFLMNDTGVLTLAEATPDGYHQLAQAKVLPGPDSWGPMALVAGRLVIRDMHRMICLDVRRR
jgi:outer membrane protein assembly factor BamB